MLTGKQTNTELAEHLKATFGLSYISVTNANGEVRAFSISDSIGKAKVADRECISRNAKIVTTSISYIKLQRYQDYGKFGPWLDSSHPERLNIAILI
jgi:hypothetical protein